MIIAYFERRLMTVHTPQRQTEYMRVLHKARMRQSFFRAAFLRRWAHLKRIGVEKRWAAVSQEGVKPNGVKVTRKNKAGV